MTYTATKIEGQNLSYKIETTLNDEPITFTVACGVDESEIPGLVQHYLDLMTNGPGPYQVSIEEVVKERERRLALGFDFNFGDARGVHRIGTTEQDMKGWDEVSKFASAAIALGQSNTNIDIVTNTGPVKVQALEWQQILVAAAQFRQPIWAKSFMIEAMNPIPEDFRNDVPYWT